MVNPESAEPPPAFTDGGEAVPGTSPSPWTWKSKTLWVLAGATAMAAIFGGRHTQTTELIVATCIAVFGFSGVWSWLKARRRGRVHVDRGKAIGWVLVAGLWAVTLVAVALLLRASLGTGAIISYGAQFLWAVCALTNLLTFGARWAPTRM